MPTKFEPNEKIVEGFRRIATASRSKVKQYLLNKAGIASHDIRVLTGASHPIEFPLDPDPLTSLSPFRYACVFFRKMSNSEFLLVNASGTSPVILEIHFFVSVPENSGFSFRITVYSGSSPDVEFSKSFTSSKEFANLEDRQNCEVFSVPVLSKGIVMPVHKGSFFKDLEFTVNPDEH